MRISALYRCSFIDYPGRLSAVVFTQGCNLRCPFCHNPGLVEGDDTGHLDEAEVLAFLGSRRGQLSGVVITGGEPTLQPGLVRFIHRIREHGLSVKLDTNGTHPEVLARLLGEGMLDYVAMDLKDPPEAYSELCCRPIEPRVLLESISVIISSRVEHEFRTTVVAPRHDARRLLLMAHAIRGAQRWILQPYRPGHTLVPDLPWSTPEPRSLSQTAAWLTAKTGIACSSRGMADAFLLDLTSYTL